MEERGSGDATVYYDPDAHKTERMCISVGEKIKITLKQLRSLICVSQLPTKLRTANCELRIANCQQPPATLLELVSTTSP